MILDDIFSGIDADSEEQMFSRLFGSKGLFRKMRTTVLLVTHAVHRLPYSDHILALDQSGHISEQGSFQELRFSGGYVQGLATKHTKENKSDLVESELIPQTLTKPITAIEDEDAEVQVAELNRRTGDFSVYNYYFAAIGWKQNTAFAVIVVAWGVGTKLPEFILTYCGPGRPPK